MCVSEVDIWVNTHQAIKAIFSPQKTFPSSDPYPHPSAFVWKRLQLLSVFCVSAVRWSCRLTEQRLATAAEVFCTTSWTWINWHETENWHIKWEPLWLNCNDLGWNLSAWGQMTENCLYVKKSNYCLCANWQRKHSLWSYTLRRDYLSQTPNFWFARWWSSVNGCFLFKYFSWDLESKIHTNSQILGLACLILLSEILSRGKLCKASILKFVNSPTSEIYTSTLP